MQAGRFSLQKHLEQLVAPYLMKYFAGVCKTIRLQRNE